MKESSFSEKTVKGQENLELDWTLDRVRRILQTDRQRTADRWSDESEKALS